jgi:outer membrane protein assembly factor BamB
MKSACFRITMFVTLATGPLVAAGDKAVWPQFLGPERNGVSSETGLNLDWKEKAPKTLWKVPIGSGYSSFAVVGDRLYTMAQSGQRDVVLCLDAKSGKEIWSCDAAPTYVDVQRMGRGPRATPTYASDRLYCLFPMGELLCVDAAKGEKRWEVDTFKAAGATNPGAKPEFYYWGVSLSPLVLGDLVIVQPGGARDGSVVAFNKDKGAKVWGVGGDPISYGSPIAVSVGGKQQVMAPTGQSIVGVDPEKGTLLWRHPFGNKFNATCSNPVWTGSELIVSAAYGGGVAALELAAREERWEVREKWQSKKNLQSLWATSVAHDGHLYGVSGDLGAILLKCLDLKTGDVKWEERLPARSSLLAAEGHLIILDERGTLHLVEMNAKRFIPKGTVASLMQYKSWAAPALAEGRLYLRDERHAVCLDLRKP